MPLLPASIPLWGYLAAGAAAFVVGKAATAGAGTADDQAAAAAPGPVGNDDPYAADSGVWDAYSGENVSGVTQLGGQFGYLPGIGPTGDYSGLQDFLDGYYGNTGTGGDDGAGTGGTGGSSGGTTGGGTTGGGTAPPPAPAPTSLTVVRPAGPAPDGAVGWVFVRSGRGAVYDARSTWKVGTYPVPLDSNTARAMSVTASRWISGNRSGKLPNGSSISVRRISGAGSASWSDAFMSSGWGTVYPASTSSAKVTV